MTKSLPWLLLQASLLVALFQPIVCPNGDMFSARRDRSSYIDTSQLISDNLNNLLDQKQSINDNRSRRPSQAPPTTTATATETPPTPTTTPTPLLTPPLLRPPHQLRHPYNNYNKPRANGSSVSIADLDDRIRRTFQLGPEKGVQLFNNTFDTSNFTSPSLVEQMQADDSSISRSSLSQSQSPSSPTDQQAFKVQRSPDGKLNLVFNDFLFFQPSAAPARPPPRSSGKAMIFPDQLEALRKVNCEDSAHEGKTFCTKVRNYPELSHLKNILSSEFSKFAVFFGDDVDPPNFDVRMDNPLNIDVRMDNTPKDEFFCDSSEKIIYPEAGITKDSNWLLIVNNHDVYKQGVRIEQCSGEGRMCKLSEHLPNGYQATCKQSYIYRSLVAITANGTITKDHFKMPSCCKCVLKQVSP